MICTETHRTWHSWHSSIFNNQRMPKKRGMDAKLGTLHKYNNINNLPLKDAKDAKISLCVILFKKMKDAKHQKHLASLPKKFGILRFFERVIAFLPGKTVSHNNDIDAALSHTIKIYLDQPFILSGSVPGIGCIVHFSPQEIEKIDVLGDVMESERKR